MASIDTMATASSIRRIVVVVVPPVDELDLVGPAPGVQLGQSPGGQDHLHD